MLSCHEEAVQGRTCSSGGVGAGERDISVYYNDEHHAYNVEYWVLVILYWYNYMASCEFTATIIAIKILLASFISVQTKECLRA
jgi:hypothetical protein